MSAVHSLGIIPEVVAGYIVVLAYRNGDGGLGLNVEFKTFRKLGSKAFGGADWLGFAYRFLDTFLYMR